MTVGRAPAIIEVREADGAEGLAVTVESMDAIDVEAVRRSLRRSFDLDADLQTISEHLGKDLF